MPMTYRNYGDLKRRKPTRWWHEHIIDDMLAFPTSTVKERAKRLDYSEDYLSIIINSDMFKAMYAERRKAYSERLDGSIAQKTAQAADRALDIVLEQLESKRGAIPFPALAEFTDRTLERLGYGVKQSGGANASVNVQIVQPSVTPEQLADARKALRAVEATRVIESTPTPQIEHTSDRLPSEPQGVIAPAKRSA